MSIRKTIILTCFALFAVLLVSAQGFAETHPAQDREPVTEKPLLWEIDGKKPSYLFGTIHVPDDRVLSLPEVVTSAFDASDAVYLEIPMGIQQIEEIQRASQLAGNQTLRNILPAPLFERVKTLVESKGVPIALLGRMKVWAVVSVVTLLDYLPVMSTQPPLDVYLFNLAGLKDKEVGGLETVAEQVNVFETFSVAEQMEFLRTTLEQIEAGDDLVEQLVKLYLAGDVELLSAEMSRQMTRDKALAEKIRRVILTERDRRMADRIETKLRDEPEKGFFFAIGAAHLSEKESVLVWLGRKGFGVDRVASGER